MPLRPPSTVAYSARKRCPARSGLGSPFALRIWLRTAGPHPTIEIQPRRCPSFAICDRSRTEPDNPRNRPVTDSSTKLASTAFPADIQSEAYQRLQALMKALPIGVSFSEDATCTTVTGNPSVMAQFEVAPDQNLSASALDPAAPGRQVASSKMVALSLTPNSLCSAPSLKTARSPAWARSSSAERKAVDG